MTDSGWLDGPRMVVDNWLARQHSIRNVVRQELAARFVAEHLPWRDRPLRVLDAGCGQGTQAIRLAVAGHLVDGVDADDRMLDAFRSALAELDPVVRGRIRLLNGRVENLSEELERSSYDVVLCHGVIMYVPDPVPVISALTPMLADDGMLSLIARNQPSIAVRAGHRGQWSEALAALRGEVTYTNELSANARADTVEDLRSLLVSSGLTMQAWYGIRVLSDTATLEEDPPPPESPELADLLDAEELAGRTDPYRSMAPLIQLIARRPASESNTGPS